MPTSTRQNAIAKLHRTIGKTAQHPVGADDPVRPLGNYGFAATFRQIGRAPCGESAASTPTNGLRICIGAFVFAGTSRRADRVVRPYGCVRVCIGASGFATSYRAGGACPSRVFLLCLHFARPSERVGLCAPLDAGQLVVELLRKRADPAFVDLVIAVAPGELADG